MSFQQLDMPNEDAVRHPPVPAELQQYAGTQALTTTSTQQGLQQVVGASSFRDIPGQLALPGINEPTQEALNDGTQSTMSCPAAAEGNSHARYHTPSASDPSTAAPLLRPESYVPTVSSRRDARSHQVLPGIVLLVGRMGRDVIDTLVAFDSGSPFCYISKCEAMRLGLNIAEWVHNKFYPTSRGGFNPRLFAISTRIRSSMQGLNDTDIALDIAIAPKIWGKVPLTLGLRAMKKLRNQSQIFCRNTDRHIHPHVLRLLERPRTVTASQVRPALQPSSIPMTFPSTASPYGTSARQGSGAASTPATASLPSLASPMTSVSCMKPTGSMLATSQKSAASSLASWTPYHQMPVPQSLDAAHFQQNLPTGTANLEPNPMQFRGKGKELCPVNSYDFHSAGPSYNISRPTYSSSNMEAQTTESFGGGPSHIMPDITDPNGNETGVLPPASFNTSAPPSYDTSYLQDLMPDMENPTYDVPGEGSDYRT